MAAGWPTGRARRAGLLVVTLSALQAAVVTAAVRRVEVCVPQVIGQWTLWTGVKETFPLGLLNAHLRVPHPPSYLRRKIRASSLRYTVIFMRKGEFNPILPRDMFFTNTHPHTHRHTQLSFEEAQIASVLCHTLNTWIRQWNTQRKSYMHTHTHTHAHTHTHTHQLHEDKQSTRLMKA